MDRLLSMRIFERVVDEGSFAAAARALDLSPPVVTRLVADLEEHLGTRLLQRSTRRLALTEAGQAYLGRVRSILQDIDEADAVVSASTQELAGLLRLHAQPALATHVVAPLLASFRERFPSILVDLEVDSGPAPAFEAYDITLLATNEGFDADIVARQVIASEAILVASPAYVARRGQPLHPDDLASHDCLSLRPSQGRTRSWRMWQQGVGSGAEAKRMDTEQEVAIHPVLSANHTDTLMRAALDGLGITSVAVDLVAPYLGSGQLVRVLSPWITGRLVLYAALPSRKFIPQRSRVFLDHLVEQTRSQAERALAACAACAASA